MTRQLKFAAVYTAILSAPLLLVLGTAAWSTNTVREFVHAFGDEWGWIYWPALLFWPWTLVLADMWRTKRKTTDA